MARSFFGRERLMTGNVKDGVGSFNSTHKREIMPVREGDGSGGSAVVGRAWLSKSGSHLRSFGY